MKFVKIVLVFILTMMPMFSLVELVKDLLEVRLDLLHFLMDVISITFFHFSAISTDVTDTIIEALFLICSILICSMFQQFEEDLQELNRCKDKSETKEKLEKLVAQHDANVQMVADLSDTYQVVLNLSLLTVIVNLINSLLIVEDGNWTFLLLIAPFVFFEVWVYCYSCQMTKTAVSFVPPSTRILIISICPN
jgi:hypothetical protein